MYFRVQTDTIANLFNRGFSFYVYGVVLLIAICTSVYKQAPKHTLVYFSMFIEWCFKSRFVLPCTNRHHTNLFYRGLDVYVYGVVLSVATCTFVYKQAPKQTYSTEGLVVYVFGVVRLVATCTSGYKQAPHKPILQGFSLLGGESAFSRILYSRVKQAPYKREKNTYQSIDSR